MKSDSAYHNVLCHLFIIGCASLLQSAAIAEDLPHPVKNPGARTMLTGSWLPEDHHRIDFDALPRLPVTHAVVSDVRAVNGVNQHNYLAYYNNQFWAMWSDGPGVEDRVGQRVKYATSPDGLNWSEPQFMTPIPPGSAPDSPHYGTRTDKGMRWISRGFWLRDGEMLALASLDEAAGCFGPSLDLRAFSYDPNSTSWHDVGSVHQNAINNFPPHKMPSGEWAMSRRKFDYTKSGVEFLVGGLKALNDWHSFPVTVKESALKANEPLWWTLPDGKSLVALFRDNRRGGYLYRAFSTDNGRTWSAPVQTDFPDATSKIFGMRISNGQYVLISNPNPLKRDPMTIAVSDDGMVFDRMFYLVGGRLIDYPHMIEHNGYLYVAHSGRKRSVEVQRVHIADLDKLEMKPARLPPPEPEILELNGIKISVTQQGPWQKSGKSPQKRQDEYYYIAPRSKGSISYSAAIPTSGKYELFAWWNTQGGHRYNAVPYRIKHAAGETELLIDQSKNGGQWMNLGTYDFTEPNAVVTVVANRFPGYVVSDGVKFRKVD
jgi:hypothetical protein